MESISQMAPDLVKALGEIRTIKKDAKNPFLKNKYASLDAIIEGTKTVLAKHNLCVMQMVNEQGIETRLVHTSGECISSGFMSIPAELSKGLSQAQARGVAITYAKRYQLGSILGISTDEDTDGQYGDNGHMEPKPEPKPEPAPKAKPAARVERVPMPTDRYAKFIDFLKKNSPSDPTVKATINDVRAKYILNEEQEIYLESVINSQINKQ